MELLTGEKLMILRMRAGVSAKALGEMTFPNLEHPNLKISRMESGRLKTSAADAKAILKALELDPNELHTPDRLQLSPKITKIVPGISDYLNLVNQAADLGNEDLLRSTLVALANHIQEKIVLK